jgi:5-oxoprolinase (ATP-hydrolysing) subunit A
MKIDINCDLGEGFGPWRMGDDEALLATVSSANVACGHHAGDPMIMAATARAALKQGVDLGAHVSFPDLAGFGRRPIPMNAAEIEAHVLFQIGALAALARAAGHRVTHLNAHGALGNLACTDKDVAEVLVRATKTFDPDMALLVLSKTELEAAARRAGMRTFNLFLADRAYDLSGQLVPRSREGAVIKDDAVVLERVRRVLADGVVVTQDGGRLLIELHSILVHGDTPGAVHLAKAIRQEINRSGGVVTPLSRLA